MAGETQWPRHVVLGGAAGGAAGFASRRVATWLCSRRSAGAKNKQPHLAPVSLSGSTSEVPSMKNTRALAWNSFLNCGNDFYSSDPLQFGGAIAGVHRFCLRSGSLLFPALSHS